MRHDDKFYHIDVETASTVEDLKCLIAIESGIDVEKQVLSYRQNILTIDGKKLADYGITNNDMINMSISNLNQADQNLMLNFLGSIGSSKPAAPKLNQKQLFN